MTRHTCQFCGNDIADHHRRVYCCDEHYQAAKLGRYPCSQCGNIRTLKARLCDTCYKTKENKRAYVLKDRHHDDWGDPVKITWSRIEANIEAIVAASEANGGRPPARAWDDEMPHHYRGSVPVRRLG